MNKIIHIYRKGEKLCDIARNYKTTILQIAEDNLISNVDIIEDFTPLIINLNTDCTEIDQLYCNVEKRGCYGCYYFK